MFDIGWPELLVIATVLIVVVGPKDLPHMLRAFGRTMAKVRGMAAEFRTQFDDALREAELDEVRKTVADVKGLNPGHAFRDAIDPLRKAGEDVRKTMNEKVSADEPAAKKDDPKVDLPDMVEPFDSPVVPDDGSVAMEPKSEPVGSAPVSGTVSNETDATDSPRSGSAAA